MTDQHPLTDEICRAIDDKASTKTNDWKGCMRAGADWQLEQVFEWMKVNLMKHDFHEGYAYLYDDCSNAYIREKELLKDLKKAMRPTTQEEIK